MRRLFKLMLPSLLLLALASCNSDEKKYYYESEPTHEHVYSGYETTFVNSKRGHISSLVCGCWEDDMERIARFEEHTYDDKNTCTICGYTKIVHNYVLVPEVPATTDTSGIKEHYTCTHCDKLFIYITGDKPGYKSVQLYDLIIPALEAPTSSYEEVESKNENGEKVKTITKIDGNKKGINIITYDKETGKMRLHELFEYVDDVIQNHWICTVVNDELADYILNETYTNGLLFYETTYNPETKEKIARSYSYDESGNPTTLVETIYINDEKKETKHYTMVDGVWTFKY